MRKKAPWLQEPISREERRVVEAQREQRPPLFPWIGEEEKGKASELQARPPDPRKGRSLRGVGNWKPWPDRARAASIRARSRSISVDGKIYPSITAAAAALGTSRATLYMWLKKDMAQYVETPKIDSG